MSPKFRTRHVVYLFESVLILIETFHLKKTDTKQMEDSTIQIQHHHHHHHFDSFMGNHKHNVERFTKADETPYSRYNILAYPLIDVRGPRTARVHPYSGVCKCVLQDQEECWTEFTFVGVGMVSCCSCPTRDSGIKRGAREKISACKQLTSRISLK